MSILKDVLARQIPAARQHIKELGKQYGGTVVDHVTVEQIFGGMRGICCLVCDTSSVPAEKGLIIRGRPIGELGDRLPEEVFWLLLTGELPDKAGVEDLQKDLQKRATVPDYVWKVLDAMPADAHAMCMFNTAILCMEGESEFRKRYDAGMRKEDFWDATFEDSLNLIARVPVVAAAIYRKKFKNSPRVEGTTLSNWAHNYARLLGIPDPSGRFADLMRLYMVIHCDHENGNVSAMATSCVNSALSDLYYSLSAGLNGLAGPLHGLANQECLNWILEAMKKFGGAPTHEQMRAYATETLGSGKVIPGYGHGVLRATDPRFVSFFEFGAKHCPDDPVYKTVKTVYETVPDVLKQLHKIKNPWPNVDAASGALLYHYGLPETGYYTVLFGVSRTLGVCAQSVINRALMLPIMRPKSVTTQWIEEAIKKAGPDAQPSKDSARATPPK